MKDRTAFAVLGATLVAVLVVGVFLFRTRDAAAAPKSLFKDPPPVPSASVAASASASASSLVPPLVIRPVTHPVAPKGSGKTLERAAADAFHAGDRKKAAALYGELAAKNPENPAFARAALMLQKQ